jgi:alanine dehydrogenase
MKVGIPIEIKNNENRVGMTPSGVFELTKRNHTVYIQKNAGFGSGFLDKGYIEAGATILDAIKEVMPQQK